ncbi:hypothetical protein GPJ56_003597 [Histomonas meleagridis]|uniref:uncharacterized protein n=1 Tax=Histomonas meleagridis TaxID=135588 RepID=UPI00355AC532|nr:hypothetical protein GPJ56_003597 [Histomonas meleagridis]KAH0800667.1 hypothetical protein GO595_006420 [Histomonas meleagridis]
MSTPQLQREKAKAIQEMDLEKTEELESILKTRTEIDNTNEVLEVTKKWLVEGIEEAENSFHENVTKIIEDHKHKTLELYLKYNELIESLKEKQQKEIDNLESKREAAISKQSVIPIPEIEETRIASKKAALNNQINEAKKFKARYEREKEKIISQRVDTVNRKYDLLQHKLVAKHKSELTNMQRKLDEAIQKEDQSYNANIKSQQKAFEVYIDHTLQRGIASAFEMLNIVKPRKFVSTELTNFVNDILEQNGDIID